MFDKAVSYAVLFSLVAIGTFLGVFCSEVILWGLGRKNTLIAEWLGENLDCEAAEGPPVSFEEAVRRMSGVNEEMKGADSMPCMSGRAIYSQKLTQAEIDELIERRLS